MFCSKCGTQVAANTKFCGKCGTAVAPTVTLTADLAPTTETMQTTKIVEGGPNIGGRLRTWSPYVPSGKWEGNWPLVLAYGLPASFFIGSAYGWLNYEMVNVIRVSRSPLVLALAAAAAGAGLMVGNIASSAFKRAKVRSPVFAVVLGVICGFATMVFAWLSFVTLLLRAEQPMVDAWLGLVGAPVDSLKFIFGDLYSYLRTLLEQANKHPGPNEPVDLMWVGWVVESAIFLGAAAIGPYVLGRLPFCESKKEWYLESEIAMPFGIEEEDHSRWNPLNPMSLTRVVAVDASGPHLKISLWELPGTGVESLVSASLVRRFKDDKNRDKVETTDVLEPHFVPQSVIDRIRSISAS